MKINRCALGATVFPIQSIDIALPFVCSVAFAFLFPLCLALICYLVAHFVIDGCDDACVRLTCRIVRDMYRLSIVRVRIMVEMSVSSVLLAAETATEAAQKRKWPFRMEIVAIPSYASDE